MKMRFKNSLLFLIVLMMPITASATMSSTNYQIFSDSVDTLGGRASSTNYNLEGSAGDQASGRASSTNYGARTGFQEMVKDGSSLSFSSSESAIALGTLSTSAVATDSLIVTATTDNSLGYTAYIKDDGNLRSGSNDIDDVTDGTVTAGSEEYGIATSGTDAQGSGDWAITTTNQSVATRATTASSVQTTIAFKAAISSATAAGSYAQVVTLSAVQNY